MNETVLSTRQRAVGERALRNLGDLPAPRGALPIVGHALQLDVPHLHLCLERWHEALGSPFALRVGNKPVFCSADPESLQTVLRERPERYRRASQIEACLEEMGANGVFSIESDGWRAQRALVMRALNQANLRGFYPALHGITERLLRRCAEAAARGESLDAMQLLMRYTVDVTTALVFGEDPNTIEREGNVIQDHLAYVFPRLMARINAPFPYWRYLKLPQDRRFDKALAAIHAHIDGLIERGRERLRSHPGAPQNLLEAMLVANDDPAGRIDDAAIRANAMTLLLAGEDTTANTLGWTLYLLAQRPALQHELQAAASGALGEARLADGFESLRRLDLFEAVATEATRFKPIVPMFFLEPRVDVELEGVRVPAGTQLWFSLRPAMRDDARFARAREFDAHRWIGERAGAHDARAYAQFGAGPRVCPGRFLAGAEIRLVLSMLMRNFDIALEGDPAAIEETLQFTMGPGRLPLRLTALG